MLCLDAGRQTLLPMEGQWSLKWRNDRIWEHFDGVEMLIEWGYHGKSEPWAVDSARRCSMLELEVRIFADLMCMSRLQIRTGSTYSISVA